MATSRRSKKPDGPFDPVTAWAQDVVASKIVAGDTTIAAADRHLRDLKDGPKRGLFWDLQPALHKINFFPTMMTITAGAKAGEPFVLLPYLMFATGSIFGWKRADGRRRFRTGYVETGKGQAKTPWAAAIGLCMMRFDGISRFEGYAVAGTENQSGIMLAEAAALCRANVPGRSEDSEITLEEYAGYQLRGTGDLTWQIEWDGAALGLGISKFRNVSTTGSISGPKPYFLAADEIHEWEDRSILEMWTAAIMKMPGDPLMLLGTNTPASDQIIGTEQSDYYTAVAKGDVQDDASFALVCTCDEGDDPVNNEGVWRKALPALDITYPAENIRDELNKAKGLPSRLDTIKRLYFGLRVGVADAWIDYPTWKSVIGVLDDEELATLPCWLGLDLSSRKDLTALAAVWRRPCGHLLARIFYWTPGGTLIARAKDDKAPYDQWEKAGYLVATPGATIPKLWPATQTARMVADHDVQAMAYDPAQILDFEESAAEIGMSIWRYEGPDEPAGDGLMMIRHGQGWRGMDNPKLLAMPTSVKAFEDVILNGKITIETNPVTNFCSSNMVLAPGANPDQRVPTRRKSRGRIDGMVALIEAVGAASVAPVKPTGSIYDMEEAW
jgi:phage terminase large subunit-like protein